MHDITEISGRIKQMVDQYAEGNVSKFASLIGTSEVNVRNYINGTQPKYEFFNKVANSLEVNCEWLLMGKTRKQTSDDVFETKSDLKTEFLTQRISDLEARLKDKEEVIDLLKSQVGLSKQTG